ncbi:uncharacterized protein LOC113274904 [Papaver somniferum]|uniref:uncharacterized protein LOC113274904 n=1 Tax=Papaver somniferum TaxID=3469 RepID=UPI000E703DED|nr:uncharacterized protein LOC113274904 [Papaver somniferum]
MSRTTSPNNPVNYLNNITPCITDADNCMFIACPSYDEVKNTVFAMKPWTTPGPDGFPGGKLYYPQRGLRQGDPLSPYLFILFMEAFSRDLRSAEDSNLINGFQVTKEAPPITHLFFADDCFVFIKARIQEANQLAKIIDQFSKFSGQAVNFGKSAVAFSPKVPGNIKNTISEIWKGKFVTPLGRTVLIQSVLCNFANRHLEVFPMPKTITDKMDSVQMNSQWGKDEKGGGIYHKIWLDLALPKNLGGLNIRRTNILNLALLTKLAWRMLTQQDEMCVQILSCKYFKNTNPLNGVVSSQGSWIWKGICHGLDIVRRYYVWEIGDGSQVDIWKDNWISNKNKPPDSTFYSSNMKKVSQLIDHESHAWNCDTLNALFDEDTVNDIMKIIIPLNGQAQLRWPPAHNGSYMFTVVVNISTTGTVRHLRKPSFPNVEKINFDASFINSSLPSGIELTLRNSTGFCDGVRCIPLKTVDVEQADALGAIEAVLWAKERGFQRIHLEGDCVNVVRAIQGHPTSVKWTTNNIIRDILYLLSDFEYWECSYAHRDANSLADSLAKFAKTQVV